MKKIFFLLFGLITLFSCQNEEIKTEPTDKVSLETFKKNWINSKLDSSLHKFDGNTTYYLFTKNEIAHLQENQELEKVRFVLGLTNEKLDLKIQGVDVKGTSLGVVNSIINSNRKITNQISEVSLSKQQFYSNDIIISQHILNPTLALNYINKWNSKLIGNNDLSEVVSYDGVRINHFSIEKEVIGIISKSSDFEYLGVVLGVNPQGKLTTVLLGLDKGTNFNFLSAESKDSDNNLAPIFDFTQPCPNTCD